MGVCMSQEIVEERVVNDVPVFGVLPEEPPKKKNEPMKPFTYENYDTPPPEKLGVVCLPHVSGFRCDRLGIFDFDESSSTYMQMVSTIQMGRGDEPGRINWTRAAASASELKKVIRSHIVVPCMATSRIYAVSVEGKVMRIAKTINSQDLYRKNLSCPYSVRTLPIKGAPVHISTMGDRDGRGQGGYILLDRHTFHTREKAKKETFAGYGGDFAFQTRHNVMITTEWGHPHLLRQGLTPSDLENVSEHFGNCLHVWKISPPELLQTIELDEQDGCLTMTVRFLHNPDINHAFACSAIGSSIFHLFMDSLTGNWIAQKVEKIQPTQVKDWECAEIPAFLTDMVISFDDRWLFVAGWLHGRIWRFDITDPFRVSLHSIINLGGLITTITDIVPVTPTDKHRKFEVTSPTTVKGVIFRGGPGILQLSLDGKRLYVGNSFYKAWDAQFYPELISDGGQIIRIDVSSTGMSLNPVFLLDFKDLDGGPFVSRDIRFLDGDCTSDNFL